VLPALLLLAVCSCSASLPTSSARLVVVNNWFGLLSAYIGFFPAALRYLAPVPDGPTPSSRWAVYAFVIGLYYRVVRISVEGETLIAIFITLMMVMTGLTISEIAFRH
jgi:hypothetical protein